MAPNAVKSAHRESYSRNKRAIVCTRTRKREEKQNAQEQRIFTYDNATHAADHMGTQSYMPYESYSGTKPEEPSNVARAQNTGVDHRGVLARAWLSSAHMYHKMLRLYDVRNR